MYADAWAHRIISDIQVFLGGDNPKRILAAGDLNTLYGYEEGGRSPSPATIPYSTEWRPSDYRSWDPSFPTAGRPTHGPANSRRKA